MNFSLKFEAQPLIRWSAKDSRPISHCRIEDKNGNVGLGCAYVDAAIAEKVFNSGIKKDAQTLSRLEQIIDGTYEDMPIETWNPWIQSFLEGESISEGNPGLPLVKQIAKDAGLLENGSGEKDSISMSEHDIIVKVSSAISGIDCALWDLQKKRRGFNTIRDLLMSKAHSHTKSVQIAKAGRRRAPLAYCTAEFTFYGSEPEEGERKKFGSFEEERQYILEDATKKLHLLMEKGFRAIKVYMAVPFANSFDLAKYMKEEYNIDVNDPSTYTGPSAEKLELELFQHAREVVGPEASLMVDAMGFQSTWAKEEPPFPWISRLHNLLGTLNYVWLEEPIGPHYREDYVAFQEKIRSERKVDIDSDKGHRCYISGCELLMGFHSFLPWIKSGAVDIIQPDVTIAGGVSVLLALKEYCAPNNVSLITHGFSTKVGFETDCELAEVEFVCLKGDIAHKGEKQVIAENYVELPEHNLDKLDTWQLGADGRLRRTSRLMNFSLKFEAQPLIRWSAKDSRPISHCRIEDKNGNVGVGCAYVDAAIAEKVFNSGIKNDAQTLSRLEQIIDGTYDDMPIETWNPWIQSFLEGESISEGNPGLPLVKQIAKDAGLLENGSGEKDSISMSEHDIIVKVSSAISGIDCALWDLQKKRRGFNTIRDLLMSKAHSHTKSVQIAKAGRRRAPLAYCTAEFTFYGSEPEEGERKKFGSFEEERQYILEDATKKLHLLMEKGFRAIKVYMAVPFANSFDLAKYMKEEYNIDVNDPSTYTGPSAENLEFELFQHAREVVGPEASLMVDAMGFQSTWAKEEPPFPWISRLHNLLETLNYVWLEEPIGPHYREDYVAFQEKIRSERKVDIDFDKGHRCYISGCELLMGFHSFLPWIESGAVDIIQPDVTIAGGVSVLLALKEYCAPNNVSLITHGFSTKVGFETDCELAEVEFVCIKGDIAHKGEKQVIAENYVELPEHNLNKLDTWQLGADGRLRRTDACPSSEQQRWSGCTVA